MACLVEVHGMSDGGSWHVRWRFMACLMEVHGMSDGGSWHVRWRFMACLMEVHGMSDGSSWHVRWRFMMTMSTNTSGETVILKIWDTGTIPGLVFAMLVSVILAVLLEYIHVIMKFTLEHNGIEKTVKHRKEKSSICSTSMKTQMVVTIYHVLRVAVGYCLMLFVMTFNIWIYTAVVLGSGTGFYLSHAFPCISNASRKECETDSQIQLSVRHDDDIDVHLQEEETLYVQTSR
ncbi:protein SLC31A2-like [Ylistrum balloti]|uniref:protein SLC31A2-like n=1 Tax=Ylistrum balloti TaxID=509963 RepID=UPI002905C51A|nr:protein SLC31A2-like [Ylistrum balloti]